MSQGSHHFIPPLKYYVGTFLALLFLTFITVWIAQFDMGILNVPVAMAIAMLKAALVVGFFMGLHWDRGMSLIFFISGVIGLLIFIIFTMVDITSRGDIDSREAGYHSIDSPVHLTDSPSH